MDRETIERCAKVCEEQAVEFLSEGYAVGQPLSSFEERFACSECAKAIRALPSEPPASHAIITKLIGYAGHDDGCFSHAAEIPHCSCGYGDTLAEARKFMESGDE